MDNNIVVEIEKAPKLAELISDKLNQLGYIGNVANLLANKTHPATIDTDFVIKEHKSFFELLSFVEVNFTYKVKQTFSIGLSLNELNNLFKKAPKYNKLSDLIKNIAQVPKHANTLTEVYLGYIASWQMWTNVRLLKIKADKDSIFQNAFNCSILRLYENYLDSNSIDKFLNSLFSEYYYGYILGDDILKNLFLGWVRFYIYLKEESKELLIDDLVESIFNVKTLYEEKNKKIAISSYKAIVSFCYEKLKECLESINETELMLSHAKLKGLVHLISSLYSDFNFISQNANLSIHKDFFEEIFCDIYTITLSYYSYFKCPSYSHWLIELFSITNDSMFFNKDRLISAAKERIFLSKQVREFIESQITGQIDRWKLINEINRHYSDLDERFILSLYYLKNINPRWIRKVVFPEEIFKSEAQLNFTYSDDIYEKYISLDTKNIGEVSNEVRDCIFSTHFKLCNKDITELINAYSATDISVQEKAESIILWSQMYPFNSSIGQELAILLDLNGFHEQALDVIVSAILLDFNNVLLWESLRVIFRNLEQPESYNTANFICNSKKYTKK